MDPSVIQTDPTKYDGDYFANSTFNPANSIPDQPDGRHTHVIDNDDDDD